MSGRRGEGGWQCYTAAMTCAVQFLARAAVVLLLFSAPAAWGQIGDDCTEVEIHYEDDATLTKAEKLALMEQAFQESLSRYSHCQNSSGGGAQSGASASIAGTEGEGEGEGEGGGGGEAAASASVSGTEAAAEQKEPAQTAAAQQPGGDSGGKLPEDIPPADNDSIVEAQIRAAAMAEPDPETKAALWNEYRKYKGLPTVDEESQ